MRATPDRVTDGRAHLIPPSRPHANAPGGDMPPAAAGRSIARASAARIMEMRAPRGGGGGRLLSPAASFIFDGPGFCETARPNMVKRGAVCTRPRGGLCARPFVRRRR
ncbi:hypothetical protein MTO96_013485 [Rhipicephalus appendiculatus]